MEQFKYLGCVMSMDDNNVPAMQRNLKRAGKTRGRLRKILEKEEVSAKAEGIFYSWIGPPVETNEKSIAGKTQWLRQF